MGLTPAPTNRIAAASSPLRGALAIGSGAALWGLFWIPLRRLDADGVDGLWSVALVGTAATLVALPLAIRRDGLHSLFGRDARRVGFALGLSGVLYFAGILFSDVVRVVFLFYLLPVWTILAARLLHGEPIRPRHLLVVAAALTGLWLLLGGGTRLPLPRNAGDVCGLAAGLCWGISLALLRGHSGTPPYASTALAMATTSVLAALLALSSAYAWPGGEMSIPRSDTLLAALPLALAFGACVLYPAMLGQIWGARLVPAATASFLTMTEILVATGSAWWLIGTTLEPIAYLGGGLIVSSVLLDLALQRRDPTSPHA